LETTSCTIISNSKHRLVYVRGKYNVCDEHDRLVYVFNCSMEESEASGAKWMNDVLFALAGR
jgi:hypothetical protein